MANARSATRYFCPDRSNIPRKSLAAAMIRLWMRKINGVKLAKNFMIFELKILEI